MYEASGGPSVSRELSATSISLLDWTGCQEQSNCTVEKDALRNTLCLILLGFQPLADSPMYQQTHILIVG